MLSTVNMPPWLTLIVPAMKGFVPAFWKVSEPPLTVSEPLAVLLLPAAIRVMLPEPILVRLMELTRVSL